MNEDHVEQLLRKAPQPLPPETLRETLEGEIPIPPMPNPRQFAPVAGPPFWRRWLPALAYGCLLLGCLVVLGVQTVQILDLRREQERLHKASEALEQVREQNEALRKEVSRSQTLDQLKKDQTELRQLRDEIARLSELSQALPNLRAEQARLTAEVSNRMAQASATGALEPDPFAEEKQKAMRINCVNNLKQIGLAARIYASDHGDVLPGGFLVMSNELNTAKILFCAARTAPTQPPSHWHELNASEVTYVILSPGVSEQHPDVVYARCPIHNNVAMVDGSVQQLPPDARIVEVNGLKKITRPARTQPAP